VRGGGGVLGGGVFWFVRAGTWQERASRAWLAWACDAQEGKYESAQLYVSGFFSFFEGLLRTITHFGVVILPPARI